MRRRFRKSCAVPTRVCVRYSTVMEIKAVGVYQLLATDRDTYPRAFRSLFKEFRCDGAVVACKRYNPPAVVFGTTSVEGEKYNFGQVANNELFWVPWSGVDVPDFHPRSVASACLLNEQWCVRFVKSRGIRINHFMNIKRPDNHEELKTYVTGSPPWLPIDDRVYDIPANELNSSGGCHSLGAFYVSQSDAIPTKVEVEAKLYYRMRGRKSLNARNVDITTGVDIFPTQDVGVPDDLGTNSFTLSGDAVSGLDLSSV